MSICNGPIDITKTNDFKPEIEKNVTVPWRKKTIFNSTVRYLYFVSLYYCSLITLLSM